MTHPKNHKTKARAVKQTWARFCDTTLFFSNGAAGNCLKIKRAVFEIEKIKKRNIDSSFPIIHLDVFPGRFALWPKVRKAFAFIHEHFQGQYDWVMKADDDS
jgi:glycoprotein-N-acetylgalactosamine 3-beta-galactosyltransferase